ncbi:metalloregulator ArsR/SmtB family transcription factor [Ferrimonas balearica]|uniref:metalloregulator ArsR/SmtB family transcription factor n=1 Tax=Ferrimonas balearica TaxID=44012 RepID=UPI001C96E2F3|nr:metalloregulator ArsR/SmtB family transcription factor [Ferrimonas balearica]MBY6225777.1 metalloregulator ArsR/SmtB family transcription factor [Ferrimonas balearica]
MSHSVAQLKSLSDETRLKILLLIRQETELCVCELTCALDESQPKVSRHLARLRADGLLEDRRSGQWVYYRLAALPDWIVGALEGIAGSDAELIDACAERLANMGDRPQRQQSCCA